MLFWKKYEPETKGHDGFAKGPPCLYNAIKTLGEEVSRLNIRSLRICRKWSVKQDPRKSSSRVQKNFFFNVPSDSPSLYSLYNSFQCDTGNIFLGLLRLKQFKIF